MKRLRGAVLVLLVLAFVCAGLLPGFAVARHDCCSEQAYRVCLDCVKMQEILRQAAGAAGLVSAALAVLFLLRLAQLEARKPHAPTLVMMKMRMDC